MLKISCQQLHIDAFQQQAGLQSRFEEPRNRLVLDCFDEKGFASPCRSARATDGQI